VNLRLDELLAEAIASIKGGRCDNLDLLGHVATAVARMELADPGTQRRARNLLATIDDRRTHVLKRYRKEAAADPQLKSIFLQFDRGAVAWPL
jgi:hypothetical protein